MAQNEAMLQPHHARAFGVVIDGCDGCHLSRDGRPGCECINISEGTFHSVFMDISVI